jgi:hypothetical protein
VVIGAATVLQDLLPIVALIARLLQISIFYPMAVSLEVSLLDVYHFLLFVGLLGTDFTQNSQPPKPLHRPQGRYIWQYSRRVSF